MSGHKKRKYNILAVFPCSVDTKVPLSNLLKQKLKLIYEYFPEERQCQVRDRRNINQLYVFGEILRH